MFSALMASTMKSEPLRASVSGVPSGRTFSFGGTGGTLVTRAGPGTKVVCLGNIAQIDTPYLTEGSSGLTYVVDRFKGWPHSGHVTRPRLACRS